MEIVIASRNVGKIREFREILNSRLPSLDVSSLLAFPTYEALPEEGDSFLDIATKKALHAAKTLNRLVLADDSGIVVPILGNQPGVLSRRFAGPNATDRDNCDKLLQMLQGKSEESRQAYFECALVLASPTGVIKTTTGRVEGFITDNEKGRGGFGYDCIFIKHDYDKTFAELSEDVKNRISHRRKAIDLLLPTLEGLIR